MTVQELIVALLDLPRDAVVVRSAGEDQLANVMVTDVDWSWTYSDGGRRKAVVIR